MPLGSRIESAPTARQWVEEARVSTSSPSAILRSGDVYGIAPGADIGIIHPTVSLGTAYGQSGWGTGAILAAGAILSSVVGSTGHGGGDSSSTTGAPPPITVDPYPDYEGEVTPETHPDLYLPPDDPQIPSPEERYESALPPVLIGETASEDPYEPDESEIMPTFSDILLGGLNSAIDIAQGQGPAPTIAPVPVGFAPTAYPGVPAGTRPAPVQIDPRTGRPVCKRRRRRRLLTESDFNDLMRIATLPNKQNVTVALAKAVGRR